MKTRITALICICVLVAALVSACGSKRFAVENATRIEVQSGTTGERVIIDDAAQVRTVTQMFADKDFARKGSAKGTTGWGYRLTFYADAKITEEFFLMSNGIIDCNGAFYESGDTPNVAFFDALFDL